MKMNAAMFYAPKDVRFERIDVPKRVLASCWSRWELH